MTALGITGADHANLARVASKLYDTIQDTPSIDDDTLKIVANALARP